MANTKRNLTDLNEILKDNNNYEITAQDVRDMLVSLYGSWNTTEVSASYTNTINDIAISYNAISGSLVHTLSGSDGTLLYLIKKDATANTVTVSGASTIAGLSGLSLTQKNSCVLLLKMSDEWKIVADQSVSDYPSVDNTTISGTGALGSPLGVKSGVFATLSGGQVPKSQLAYNTGIVYDANNYVSASSGRIDFVAATGALYWNGTVLSASTNNTKSIGSITNTFNKIYLGTGDSSVSGTLAIGAISATTKLDVMRSSSGRSWSVSNDDIVSIENNGNANLNIRTSITGTGSVLFSDVTARLRGYIAYKHSDDSLVLAVDGTEKVFVTSAGNVGVGVTPTEAMLHVNGDIFIPAYSKLGSSAGMKNTIQLYDNYSGDAAGMQFTTYYPTVGSFRFFTGGRNSGGTELKELFTIKYDGKVGIGNPNPSLGILEVAVSGTSPTSFISCYSTIATDGPVLVGLHSKTSTVGALSATDDNSKLLTLQAQCVSGSTSVTRFITSEIIMRQAGLATAPGGDIEFWTANSGTVRTQKMIISGSGNVGINVVAPTSTLSVGGNVNASSEIVAGTYLGFGGSVRKIDGSGTGLSFFTNSAERITVLSGGEVGIGITTPQTKLYLKNGQFTISNNVTDVSTYYNSQGVQWSTIPTFPSIIFNATASERPELSIYRGSRTYPEFSLRCNDVDDTGVTLWTGAGTVAPSPTIMLYNQTVGIGISGTTPTSTLDVNGSIEIPSNKNYFIGDPTTDGTWRFAISGTDLIFQRRESGVFVTKSTILAS